MTKRITLKHKTMFVINSDRQECKDQMRRYYKSKTNKTKDHNDKTTVKTT